MPRARLWWAAPLFLILAGVGLYVAWPRWAVSPEEQVARLTGLLHLSPGQTAAEIGAGDGQMTVLLAKRLGPSSRVFSTELSPRQVSRIRQAAAQAGLSNVTVIRAAERVTNLDEDCCDAVFLRRVFHHFSDPPAIAADLFRVVRPGGRVAVVDFARSPWRFWRGRHGVRAETVIGRMTAAGFTLERRLDDWPGGDYCLVFRKRLTAASGPSARNGPSRPSGPPSGSSP